MFIINIAIHTFNIILCTFFPEDWSIKHAMCSATVLIYSQTCNDVLTFSWHFLERLYVRIQMSESAALEPFRELFQKISGGHVDDISYMWRTQYCKNRNISPCKKKCRTCHLGNTRTFGIEGGSWRIYTTYPESCMFYSGATLTWMFQKRFYCCETRPNQTISCCVLHKSSGVHVCKQLNVLLSGKTGGCTNEINDDK